MSMVNAGRQWLALARRLMRRRYWQVQHRQALARRELHRRSLQQRCPRGSLGSRGAALSTGGWSSIPKPHRQPQALA